MSKGQEDGRLKGASMATNGISKLDLKRQNRMQILKLLRNEGPTSRIDIARKIGITKAAVTIITNEMIEQGIIYEKGEQLPKGNKIPRGRKKILLDVNPTYKMGMGLVVDNGFIYFGLCTLKGDIIEKHTKAIGPEDNAEDIFAVIEKIYQDIMYKNDLKPSLVAGLGVCISKEYYGMLKVSVEPDGTVNYSGLRERLAMFVGVSMAFGSLIEGVATAETDFTQNYEEPVKNLLVFRYAKNFDCAISIGQELYRGSHGNVLDIAHFKVAQEPECTCGQSGCVSAVFSQERFLSRIKEVYSPEQPPVLWEQTAGVFQKAIDLFRQPEYIPQDIPILDVFRDTGDAYFTLFRDMVLFFDPDKIILFGEGEAFEYLTEYLVKTAEEKSLYVEKKLIARSGISLQNVFLAAASLATREFFINKGGF